MPSAHYTWGFGKVGLIDHGQEGSLDAKRYKQWDKGTALPVPSSYGGARRTRKAQARVQKDRPTCVIQLGELAAKRVLQLDAHAALLLNLAGNLQGGRGGLWGIRTHQGPGNIGYR